MFCLHNSICMGFDLFCSFLKFFYHSLSLSGCFVVIFPMNFVCVCYIIFTSLSVSYVYWSHLQSGLIHSEYILNHIFLPVEVNHFLFISSKLCIFDFACDACGNVVEIVVASFKKLLAREMKWMFSQFVFFLLFLFFALSKHHDNRINDDPFLKIYLQMHFSDNKIYCLPLSPTTITNHKHQIYRQQDRLIKKKMSAKITRKFRNGFRSISDRNVM